MSPHVEQDPPHQIMLSRALALADKLDPPNGVPYPYSTVQDQMRDLSQMTATWVRLSAPATMAHYDGDGERPRGVVSIKGVDVPVVDLAKMIIGATVMLFCAIIVALLLGRDVYVGKDGIDMKKTTAQQEVPR